MKPNFALILSSDSVCLAQRSDAGWARVGDVALDQPNGETALAQLRDYAHTLPGDHSCKLVIPDDQIKYFTLEAVGDPDETVRAALDGATPYAVGDLEYDWIADGGVLHVAAVALETLAEAEDFAVQHGFEPVCFAAAPKAAVFPGAPFFGVTQWAIEMLPAGITVERDNIPVHISHAAQPVAQPIKTDAITDKDSAAAAAPHAVAEAGLDSERAPLDSDSAPEPAPPSADSAPAPASGKAQPVPAEKSRLGAPAKALDVEQSAPVSIRASRSDNGSRAARAPLVAPPPLNTPERSAKAQGASTMPPLPGPASEPVADKARLDELAASLRPDPEARLDRDLISPPAIQPPDKTSAKPAAAPRKAEKQRMTPFGQRKNDTRGKPRFLGLILVAILLLFLVGVAAWASTVLDDGLARFFGRGDELKLANVPISSSNMPDHSYSAIFDAAQDEPPEIRPLPKAKEARNTAPSGNMRATRQIIALPERPAPLSPHEAMARYAATGIWQIAPASPEIPAAAAPLNDLHRVAMDASITFAAPASLPRRITDARDIAPQTPDQPPAAGTRFDFDGRGLVRVASEGVLTSEGVRVFTHRPARTPPATMTQTGEITTKAAPEALNDSGPDAQAGQNVPAAADPSLANLRPRVRPVSALAENPAQQTPAAAEAMPQSSDITRPPSGSKAPDPGVSNSSTAGTIAFVGDPSQAAQRPRIRPDAILATASTLQSASAAASAAMLGSAAATMVADDLEALDDAAFESATEQAVSASLIPLRRPSNFESIINRTHERAAEQPVMTPAQPKAVALKAQPVSPVQKMQPSLPTSASVSNQATDKSVLNLRQVNLIGIYGTTASRRALVRLSNGRFQKVSVGDALDGGQVAAIGETELHYVKRGRKLVLSMPQS